LIRERDQIFLRKIKMNNNNRLAEMGLIKGTIFRIVKKVHGMIQLRFGGNDVVIREEEFKKLKEDAKYNDQMRIERNSYLLETERLKDEIKELKTNVYGDDDWATPDKENK